MTVNWDSIADTINQATGGHFQPVGESRVGGGSINESFAVWDDQVKYFVKFNRVSLLSMFEAERDGLTEIHQSATIRVPRVICSGTTGRQSFLVLEYLPLGGHGNKAAVACLGQNLAAMHKVTAPAFGWYRDNTIGATPQKNTRESDWLVFWCEHRLAFQLELLKQGGYDRSIRSGLTRIMDNLDCFFVDYRPQPALLHGDLWSGNYGMTNQGEPVIFDPAVYYGDREADIAMTELFGGFPAGFYAAYNEAYPLDPGYATRKTLYNLYHILNHVNLFGSGYLGQAESMIQRLLSEIRA